MSPLDRQYHDQLDAQPQGCGDAGELNGGHSPQPELQAWHQSGAADDLMSRSLLQVQQQEAWLQSQSGSTLLDPGSRQFSALNGWAAARDDGPSGDASKRLLLVVDTSSAGWQQHLDALGSQPPGADLLFLQPGASGLQQIADALAHSDYNQVDLLAGAPEGCSLQLGSDLIAPEALASVLPLGPGQAFELVTAVLEPALTMTALSGSATAIATTGLGDAVGLVDFARQSLQEAQGSGRLDGAIAVAFDESNQAAVGQLVQAFLAAEQQPQIQWARFESSRVRGAYLGESNTILLSETLRSAPKKQLQAVLLEEIGHWLEGSSQLNGVDSAGDEGEIFAAQLFGNLTLEAAQVMGVSNDAARLLINGREQRVELSASLAGINTAPQLAGTPQAVLPNTAEDQPSTLTTAQLLQGFSDPDPGDQLRVENLHVSSGNGRLAVDANGQWTFTPEVHANGPVTLAYDVVDGHGGRLAATNGFMINAVNDAPRRLDDGPKALYVIEDAAITSLGLANLAWATGAGRDPASDQLRQIPGADEATQTLTFTVTAVPAARLGQLGLLDANNAFSPVTPGAQLSQEQMQALQFRAAADAYGTGTLTYAVSDGAAAQGGLTTTETFTINVLAVNDTPVRTSLAELAPLLIDNTKLIVDPVTNLYMTVSVGLVNLLFRAGGDALEQASQQQLLYRISQLPNATVGQVLLAGGVTAVVQGQTYSLDQLRDLIFRPARGVEKLTAAERLGELRLEVTDSPAPSGDPALTTELKVQILIDTNKASGRAGMRIAGLTSDEQAIQAVLALDPTNPDTGFQAPAGGNGTIQTVGQPKGLNTSIYSQLKSDNALYLAALGGNTVLDGQEVNYLPSAVPFLFDLPINAWAPTSWANGGPDPTHTLLYRSTLSGQLRSNDELIYTVVPGSAPAGFTLSSSGAWSFDPLHAAYAGLTTEGAKQQVTVGYQAGTLTGEITIELRRTATTMIAEVVGNVGALTTSRGDWIAANPEGRDKDRYFKYVSEYVLTSYGARDTGEKNEAGEKLFTWGGSIATADGQPLRQLNGTPITSAGYYDFTRREGLGDGVEFIYETVSEKGKQVDYITGMRFFLRNNVFGDNDPSASNIRDPGAPVTILRELGVITTLALTENATKLSSAPPPAAPGLIEVLTRLRSDGSLPGLVDIDPSQYENAAKVSMLLSSGSAGGSSSGLMAQGTGAGDDDGTSTGSAAGDPAGKGAGVGGLDAGADKIAKGRGPGDGGDSTAEGLGQGAGERGLRLDPLPILATAALATPASLLGSLSETNLLGGNLLDALALGAGLLYLLYGPKAVDQGKRGLRGWLAGVVGGSRRGAAVPGEQLVLSLILTRQENGSLQLVAAQLTAGGVKLLAQQDLASAEAWQEAASALLAGLQQQGQRYDLLLLDGQLDRALPATDQSLAALAQQRLPLATAELAAAVAAASPAEFAALQQWLNKPSLALPADSAVAQALQRRCAVHGQTLPPDQAKMAAMLELSLALTWSQRRNR